MSSKVKVVLDQKAIKDHLLNSEWIKGELEAQAVKIQERAGSGYEIRSHQTGQRIITNVYADSDEARNDNYENNTLIRSLR